MNKIIELNIFMVFEHYFSESSKGTFHMNRNAVCQEIYNIFSEMMNHKTSHDRIFKDEYLQKISTYNLFFKESWRNSRRSSSPGFEMVNGKSNISTAASILNRYFIDMNFSYPNQGKIDTNDPSIYNLQTQIYKNEQEH